MGGTRNVPTGGIVTDSVELTPSTNESSLEQSQCKVRTRLDLVELRMTVLSPHRQARDARVGQDTHLPGMNRYCFSVFAMYGVTCITFTYVSACKLKREECSVWLISCMMMHYDVMT